MLYYIPTGRCQSPCDAWISKTERDETVIPWGIISHYCNQNIQMNPQKYLFYHISRGTYRQISRSVATE